MNIKRIILFLVAVLMSAVALQAQTIDRGRSVKVKTLSECKPLLDKVKATRRAAPRKADDTPQYNVRATLKYDRLPDMAVARMKHQIFPSGSGFVVIGGNNAQLEPTRSAEVYQNGAWKTISPASTASNPSFSVILADGRVMVGGGNMEGAGAGQSKGTAIYNPATQQFTAGPNMTVARTFCNGILVNGKVYVAGNNSSGDKVYDCYNGTSFSAFGRSGDFVSPYLCADEDGSLFDLAPYASGYEEVQPRTFSNGYVWFPGHMYDVTDGKSYTYGFPFVEDHLLELPDEMRTSDYHWPIMNAYFMLTKNDAGVYKMGIFLPDGLEDGTDYIEISNFVIPTKSPSDNTTISWRGGVFYNEDKFEFYIIGTSGSGTKQNVHIISCSMMDGSWTIATATGFDADLSTAAWTMLSDGRFVCTGGFGPNYTVAKTAYVFAPPTAGTTGGDEPGPGEMVTRNVLVVQTVNGSETTFLLTDRPEATFEDIYLRVKSQKADVLFPIADVLRFTYTKRSVVGIDDLQAETDPTAVSYEQDGTLVISQLKKGAFVGVYALDGKLVRQLKADHTGTYRLSLSMLPKGVYVVKADTITYKIMKR